MIFKPRLLREKDFLTLILLQKAAEQSIDNHHRDVEQPPMEENTKPIKRPNLYLQILTQPIKTNQKTQFISAPQSYERQLPDFPLVLSSANKWRQNKNKFLNKKFWENKSKNNSEKKGYHRLLDRRVLESSTNSWVEAGSPSINLIVLAKLAIQPTCCNGVPKPGKLKILIPQFLLCAVERELHTWRQIICFPCLPE